MAVWLAAGGCASLGERVVLVEGPASPPRASGAIKLATFNLYNRPWDREVRLARAREELLALDADVVALQEVSEGWFAGRDAKPMLASLPYPYQAYFMLERRGPLRENGLYLLSRWPIEKAEGKVYEINRAFRRKGLMAATVRAPEVTLRLVNLHQASTRDSSITLPQADAVCATLGERRPGELVVVLGDFNAQLDEAPVERIIERAGLVAAQDGEESPPMSWAPYGRGCAGEAGERIDHILVSRPGPDQPWRVLSQGVVSAAEPFPSDHCIVWALVGRQD
ncbi:MAG: endonuclease/exonuclease/phosphatase family protein [Myxococcales bacterium]